MAHCNCRPRWWLSIGHICSPYLVQCRKPSDKLDTDITSFRSPTVPCGIENILRNILHMPNTLDYPHNTIMDLGNFIRNHSYMCQLSRGFSKNTVHTSSPYQFLFSKSQTLHSHQILENPWELIFEVRSHGCNHNVNYYNIYIDVLILSYI